MTRKRDVEAIEVATEIADTISATADGRATGILVGARAYRRGQSKLTEEINGLRLQVQKLERELATARATAQWTPAEIAHLQAHVGYGLSHEDAAKLYGVDVTDIKKALALGRSKKVRLASDRKRERRPRMLDTTP